MMGASAGSCAILFSAADACHEAALKLLPESNRDPQIADAADPGAARSVEERLF